MNKKEYKRIKRRDLAVKKFYGNVDLYKLPTSFWFKKYSGAKRTHFAFIKYENEKFYIYFVNERGQIFDRLPFNNIRTPKRLLRKNKFVSSNNKKCDIKPTEPFEKRLMIAKKSRPYSKGTLWASQERYKRIKPEQWEKYQEYAKRTWYGWSNYTQFKYGSTYEKLIEDSETKKFGNFNISAKRTWDTDLEITFESDFGESEIWLASSMNYISHIWRFLESIIKSGEKRNFYYCDEEGTDGFLYVKKYKNEFLKFIHISTVKSGSFKVVQNILIPQEEFITKFYYAIINGIKNYDKDNSEEFITKNNSNYKDFIDLIKGSAIIKTYLFGSG